MFNIFKKKKKKKASARVESVALYLNVFDNLTGAQSCTYSVNSRDHAKQLLTTKLSCFASSRYSRTITGTPANAPRYA